MTQSELLSTISKESTLNEMQEYIRKIFILRGIDEETISESMLMLLEETGELAKAIRKSCTKMSVDVDKMGNYSTVESEVADVFIVLVAICNSLGINLFDAIVEKEKVNCERKWSFER